MNGSEFQEIHRVLAELRKRISVLEEAIESYNLAEKIREELKIQGLIERSAEDE
jgi:hypothetical protein